MWFFNKIPKKATATGGAVVLLAFPLVAQFEGLRLKAYLDMAGIPTICYGETLDVSMGDVKSKEECDTMLAARIAYFAHEVDKAITPSLPSKTHAALASWTYNVGVGAMQKSTLVRLANNGDLRGACNQLLRWDKVKGQTVRGLTLRRQKERELCLEGLNDSSTH